MNLLNLRRAFSSSLSPFFAYLETKSVPWILNEALRDRRAAQWNASHCRTILAGNQRCEMPLGHGIHLLGRPGSHKFRPIGSAQSVHCNGLAVDLLIMPGGQISNARTDYAPLGAHWKTLHPLARWGGDFKGFADLGHFSFEYRGRK